MVSMMERSAVENKICYNCWNSISHHWKNCPEPYRSIEEKEVLRCQRKFPLTHWWADLLKYNKIQAGSFPRHETMDYAALIQKDREMKKENLMAKGEKEPENLIDFEELGGYDNGEQIQGVNGKLNSEWLAREDGGNFESKMEVRSPATERKSESYHNKSNNLSGIETALTELVSIFKTNTRISQDLADTARPDQSEKSPSSHNLTHKEVVKMYNSLNDIKKSCDTASDNDKKLEASINSMTKRLEFLETDQRNFQTATRHKLANLEDRFKQITTHAESARNKQLEATITDMEARMRDVKNKQENFEDQIPTAGDVVHALDMNWNNGEGIKLGNVGMVQMQMRMNAMYDQQLNMVTQLQIIAGRMDEMDSRIRAMEGYRVQGTTGSRMSLGARKHG